MGNSKEKLTVQQTAKRYILFLVGLFISGFGVAVTKKAELGVTTISSVSNVLSEKYDFLSFGNWLILWNLMLIVVQVIILKKNFKLIQLLQIPVSFLFGYFTDFGLWILSGIQIDMYMVKIVFVVVGTILLGFGISLTVIANTIMNCGEAFVKAVSDITGMQFGNVKILFDIFCVVTAVVLSLVLFDFTIVGTREGTLIAVFLNGLSVKFFTKRLSTPIEKILK